MLNKIFFILLFSSYLYASTLLQNSYMLESNDIHLQDLIPDAQKNLVLFSIAQHKHSMKIKSSKLLEILHNLEIKDIKTSSRYINFKIKSPIRVDALKIFIRDHYLQKYKTLELKDISVTPRSYLDAMPKKYNIEIRRKNHLSHKGIFNIKDENNKKIFFNYTVHGKIKILQSKVKIQRDEKISFLNVAYKTIEFDKFRALPLMHLGNESIQASRQIKNGNILTMNDTEALDLVHKNKNVVVSFNNDGIYITFNAKALQNGKLGDIITIQKSDLKRLKAKVIGKKKVEMR